MPEKYAATRILRSFAIFLIALLVIAWSGIAFVRWSKDSVARRAATDKRQNVVELIKQAGGVVVFKATDPTKLMSVHLSGVSVDSELLRAVVECDEIERLRFDGGNLQVGDCELLKSLPQLRGLSLVQTNVTDAHIAQLPQYLDDLSLSGTAITDKSMPYVAAMEGLTNLDITNTGVTPEGLRQLEPLALLERLQVDSACISAESARALGRMQPKGLDIAVSGDLGKQAHLFLSVYATPNMRGIDESGHLMWEANKKWSQTLAGIVEAVGSELELNSEQSARLLEALSTTSDWEPAYLKPLPAIAAFSFGLIPRKDATGIANAEKFVQELNQERERGVFDYQAVIQYVREKFTANDIPTLLAAMRSTPDRNKNYLFYFGPFLLIHFGIDLPGVTSELDRLLSHQDGFIRINTIYSFVYGGAIPFYSREEWTPSEAADAFAVPRLLRLLNDESENDLMRGETWRVLAEIANRRPEFAAQIMPALVNWLDAKRAIDFAPGVYLLRIAEVAPDAAVAAVPGLRAKLDGIPDSQEKASIESSIRQTPARSLRDALAATASASPQLSREIAVEYLDRLRDDRPTGPFASLLSPANPDITRRIVLELLNAKIIDTDELASVAKEIRDWRDIR